MGLSMQSLTTIQSPHQPAPCKPCPPVARHLFNFFSVSKLLVPPCSCFQSLGMLHHLPGVLGFKPPPVPDSSSFSTSLSQVCSQVPLLGHHQHMSPLSCALMSSSLNQRKCRHPARPGHPSEDRLASVPLRPFMLFPVELASCTCLRVFPRQPYVKL